MKEVSLYIHIPFCKQKCWYCDFPSFAGKEDLMDEYLKALRKEVNNRVKDVKIKTIFVGGGTPTYLHLEGILELGNIISGLNTAEDLEFTVEANPGTLTEEKLKALKDIGVNRISIGLQAVQNNHLKDIGRIHTFNEFKENFYKARNAGFNNINVDLMFGLPNQTIKDWEESLKEISSLEPEHISAYSLIIEEGTPFKRYYEKGILRLPTEEEERTMYNMTLDTLGEKGYTQYEISNFSKTNRECKHNIVYWDLNEYIGVGSSSSSYINGKRYRNQCSIEKYIDEVNEKSYSFEEVIENSLEDNMEEFMFMGLRKIDGISIDDFNKRFENDIYSVYGKLIDKYKSQGLLIEEKGRIYLSYKGIEVSNVIMSDFILS